jgi:hypothetical protein
MARSTVPLLSLFTFLVLSLASCGGGGGGGGGEATSANTAGSQTTPAASTTSGGEKEGTAPSEMTSSTVDLVPVNPDTSGTASLTTGASGTASLTDTDGGVEVGLRLQNLEDLPDAEHPAEIHQGGTCADVQAGDDSAPVLYSLNSVFTAANHAGSSRTQIPGVSVAELLSGTPKYINVLDEQHGDQTPPSIACADLSSSSSGGNTIAPSRQD